MYVRTKHVVYRFIRNYLQQKGLSHKMPVKSQSFEDDYEAELDEICRALGEISNELQEFVQKTNSDRLKALAVRLLDNFDYESFETVMDELFRKGIRWNHVVTFFVYAAETACAIAEGKLTEMRGREQDGIKLIITWTDLYTDEKLIQWIESQKGGWSSIKSQQQPVWLSVIKNSSVWPLAVFAVFIGGLYISKMSP